MEKNPVNTFCKALIIGGSAGGIEVLMQILPLLTPGIKFPIVIVLHRSHTHESTLADVFSHHTKIPVVEIEDKDPVKPGVIYLAPPDYHLLFETESTFVLDVSEKVHYCRPSIDVTFNSAAETFGNSVVCVLLSGTNTDGVDGLKTVTASHGIAIVQDPSTAEVSYMPAHAILHHAYDLILKPLELADYINNLR